jgi:hypothetical protein
MPRKPRTLLEVCVARAAQARGRSVGTLVDVPKATRACSFIIEWAIASIDVGGPLTTREFAEWWHVSEPTVERRRRELRQLFPDQTPQEVANVVIAAVEKGRSRVPSPSMVVA